MVSISYLRFFFVIFVLMCSCESLGLIVSCVSSHSLIAITVAPVAIVPGIVLSGFFVAVQSLNPLYNHSLNQSITLSHSLTIKLTV